MTISTSLWNHVTAGSWRANHLMCIQDGISPNRHLHHHKAIPKVWKQQRSRPFIWAGQRKQSSFLSNLLLGWLGWLPVWPSVQCKMMMSQKEINSATGSKLYSVQVVHVYTNSSLTKHIVSGLFDASVLYFVLPSKSDGYMADLQRPNTDNIR